MVLTGGLFSVVTAESTVNWVSNPSTEVDTTNWAAIGAGTVSRGTTAPLMIYGRAYPRIVTGAVAQDGMTYDEPANTLRTTGTYSVSFWVRTLATSYANQIRLTVKDGGTTRYDALIPLVDTTPRRVSVTGITLTSTSIIHIEIKTETAVTRTVYVDGIQIENKAYVTDYCDGDQPGCSWSGTAHASTSSRSAQYRGAGREINFDDYSVRVTTATGMGLGPVTNGEAFLPGQTGTVQTVTAKSRVIQLVISAQGTSVANLHALRQALIAAIQPWATDPPQPFMLRYTGAGRSIQIACTYEQGLDGTLTPRGAGLYGEFIVLRVLARNPYWQELYGAAAVLDVQDTATARLVVGQIDGLWGVLGPPAAPGTAVYTNIRAIVVGPDRCVYVGGDFLNFDNTAACDYVAKYNPVTGAWSALGTGLQGGACRGLCFDSAGNLWAVGAFTGAGGVANTNKVAYWNGTTWVSPDGGTGPNLTAIAVACGQDGTIYIGGSFTSISGNARAFVSRYTGSAWAALSTGTDADVYAIAIGLDGKVWIAGVFSYVVPFTIPAIGIAYWDPNEAVPAWHAVGNTDGTGNALAVGKDGSIYLGGQFTTAGGIACANIARYFGNGFTPLGSGLNNYTWALAIHPATGVLYASGQFTSAGGIPTADRVAKWNGYTWSNLDIDLPGSPVTYALYISWRGRIFVGFDTTGTATYAGQTTVTYAGTAPVTPRLTVQRTGSAGTLESLTNVQTGREVLFNLPLAAGETVTIDLATGMAYSDYTGIRHGVLLSGQAAAQFVLQPGANLITALCTGSVPTVWLSWVSAFSAADAAA